MSSLYFDIDLTQKENHRTKKEPVNFLTRVLESVHSAIDTVATAIDVKKVKRKPLKKRYRGKKDENDELQDFFGALNY
jgi:hypothetical protein